MQARVYVNLVEDNNVFGDVLWMRLDAHIGRKPGGRWLHQRISAG